MKNRLLAAFKRRGRKVMRISLYNATLSSILQIFHFYKHVSILDKFC
jgi:hypothetical protein